MSDERTSDVGSRSVCGGQIKRSKAFVGGHCCAKMIWAEISPRMAYVMWREEQSWNFGVLHRVRLSSLVQKRPILSYPPSLEAVSSVRTLRTLCRFNKGQCPVPIYYTGV
jgi:hypothetical protein